MLLYTLIVILGACSPPILGWTEEQLLLAPHLALSEEEYDKIFRYEDTYEIPDHHLPIIRDLSYNNTIQDIANLISQVHTTEDAENVTRKMIGVVNAQPEIHDPLMSTLKLMTGLKFETYHKRLRRSPSGCSGGGSGGGFYMETIVVTAPRPQPRPIWSWTPIIRPIHPGRRCPPMCGGGGAKPAPSPTETVSADAKKEKAKGEAVAKEVSESVEKVLGDANGFLEKIACVESDFGNHKDTYRNGYDGGMFQVDRIGYEDTKNAKAHPGLTSKFNKIQTAYGIDWKKTSWGDLKKPLYSAIAARLLLSNKPGAIPGDLKGQARYWKTHYNSALGAGTPQKFIDRWNAHQKKKKE